eukprot:3026377-Pleurochrysis_carterae.AAC.1
MSIANGSSATWRDSGARCAGRGGGRWRRVEAGGGGGAWSWDRVARFPSSIRRSAAGCRACPDCCAVHL